MEAAALAVELGLEAPLVEVDWLHPAHVYRVPPALNLASSEAYGPTPFLCGCSPGARRRSVLQDHSLQLQTGLCVWHRR